MVTTIDTTNRVALSAPDGQVYAYLIPAADLDRMQAEIAALREQVARLTRRCDLHVAELTDMLKTHIPIPPTEEEMREAEANPGSLANLIVELEAADSPITPLIVLTDVEKPGEKP